jgi:mRNA interferase MazF
MRPIHIASLDKPRPVVLLTREVAVPYMGRVTVAPITTRIRGLSTEVGLDQRNGVDGPCVVSCDNITTIRTSDLGRVIGFLLPEQESVLVTAISSAFALEPTV